MTSGKYYFDERTAQLAERFFDRILVHVEGPMAGRPFKLEPWQRRIVRNVWGWKRADGARKYRRLYLEVPRGNGKSSFSAGLALLLLAVDGERSAKVFGAAADKEQASIVFNTAREMVKAAPVLNDRIRVYRNKTMLMPESASEYRVLSSDAFTKHGLNPSGIIFDELHAQPSRELYDVLATAMGKRKQPLMVMITTAGYDRNSVCWEMHEYARQVAEGIIDDPTFYPAIYAAAPDDDWTSPATWAQANPNYGVSVQPDFLAQECQKALASPAYVNTFKRLYLDIWTSQETRWLDMRAWDEGGGALPDLSGRPAYMGIDLSSTIDMSAAGLVFPPWGDDPNWYLLPHFWIPEDGLVDRERRDRAPYGLWAEQGLLTLTPGSVIDYSYILNYVDQVAGTYNLAEIGIDPWNSVQIALALEEKGYVVVQVRQGYQTMSAPTKEMLRLVQARRIRHGDNPILRWQADGAAVAQDEAGNIKLAKNKATQRIDGIVAEVIALSRGMLHGDHDSVYEERGIRTL